MLHAAMLRRWQMIARARARGGAKASSTTRVTACVVAGVLDPVTETLTAFEDADNLVERIDDVYNIMDADGSGGLNFEVR